jgi:putative hemolysin
MQDLHGAATMARITRLIGQREEGIIVSASRLASTPLRKVMLPAEYMDMLIADLSLAQALVAAHQGMHTRYPVTEEQGNPQRIIGYVNFKDIVATLRTSPGDPSFRNLIRHIDRFDADASVADCMEHLMRERNHIGLVREDDGTVVGMVTLEDILEELVGEIHDEMDRMPTYLNSVGKGWIAGGFVSLKRLRERTGIVLATIGEKPIYTLSDWIVERLARPPKGGDTVNSDTCRIVVRKTRNVLVQEAYLYCASDPETPAASGE